MIVELYGLPGSGKTTYAQKESKVNGLEIIKVKKRRELFFLNVLFFMRYPIKCVVLLIVLIGNSHNIRLFYSKFMNAFLHHNAKYIKAKFFRKGKKVIIDQGHFQNIISILEKKVSSRFMKRYVNFLPTADELIIFQLNQKERLERIDKRNYGVRDDFDGEYKKVWFEVIDHNDRLFRKQLNFLKIKSIIKHT